MSEALKSCPFCGGEAEIIEVDYEMYLTGYAIYCRKCCLKLGVTGRLGEAYEWSPVFDTEAEAIAAWNARAEQRSEPPYDSLIRCLENDWHISASWDGLRKFWNIGLTDEGVRLRDGMLNARFERTCKMRQHMWMPIWTCSVCGASNGGLFGLDKYEPPKICPNCGCKAVGE